MNVACSVVPQCADSYVPGQGIYPGMRCKHTALWRVVQFERLQRAGKRKESYERREDSAKIEMRFANVPHSI
jgi:hypothetical protein